MSRKKAQCIVINLLSCINVCSYLGVQRPWTKSRSETIKVSCGVCQQAPLRDNVILVRFGIFSEVCAWMIMSTKPNTDVHGNVCNVYNTKLFFKSIWFQTSMNLYQPMSATISLTSVSAILEQHHPQKEILLQICSTLQVSTNPHSSLQPLDEPLIHFNV